MLSVRRLRDSRRSFVVALSVLALAAGVTTTSAGAENPNQGLLTAACTNGETLTFELDANGTFPSALRVVSSTGVFTVHAIVATDKATGETFVFRSKSEEGVARNKELVSCSREGVDFDFTWVGFFTPA